MAGTRRPKFCNATASAVSPGDVVGWAGIITSALSDAPPWTRPAEAGRASGAVTVSPGETAGWAGTRERAAAALSSLPPTVAAGRPARSG